MMMTTIMARMTMKQWDELYGFHDQIVAVKWYGQSCTDENEFEFANKPEGYSHLAIVAYNFGYTAYGRHLPI